jgi:hypothetical protein
MQIPAREKGKWTQVEVEQNIAEFIKDTKFLKYTGAGPLFHLLVHLNFDSTHLNLEKAHREMQRLTGNPFHQIWLIMATSPDWDQYGICLIHPEYKFTAIDLTKDHDLVF